MSRESDLERMKRETMRFFELHWNKEAHGKTYPEWKAWHFHKTIPNGDKGGCYAMIREGRVEYVGVGIGKSTKRYEGSGLGDRLKVYYRVDKEKNEKEGIKKVEDRYFKPRPEWEKITEIWTIGFPKTLEYLAAALEIFLIQRLDPPGNTRMKR